MKSNRSYSIPGRYTEMCKDSKDIEELILFNFEGLQPSEKDKRIDPYGGVAQLGEHLPCKQGVRSSILLISTKGSKRDSESH